MSGTVHAHVEHILAKLNGVDRTQAAVLAREPGVIERPPHVSIVIAGPAR